MPKSYGFLIVGYFPKGDFLLPAQINSSPLLEDLRSPTLISFLDLARWVAAAIVCAGHIRNPLFLGYAQIPEGSRTWWVKIWYFVTGCHAEAVVVFFVLSGFLIGATGIARAKAREFNNGSYAIDRVTRLYVAYLPALLIGFMADGIGSWFFEQIGFWNHTHPMIAQKVNSEPFSTYLSGSNLIGNVFMLQTFFFPPLGSNQPLWSISAEFWFYVVFLIIINIMTMGNTFKVRLFCAFLLALTLIAFGIKFIILLGLWAIGVFIAFVPPNRFRLPVISACIFLCALILGRLAHSYTESNDILRELKNYFVALLFAWLIISMRGQNYRWLSRMSKFNSFLSAFSFSLYLLHFPLMLLFLAIINSTGMFPGISVGYLPTDAVGLIVYFLTLALVFSSAWLFSLATERNTGKARRFLNQRLSGLRS